MLWPDIAAVLCGQMLLLQFVMASGRGSVLWSNVAAAICYGQRSRQFFVAKCCCCNLLWPEVLAVRGQMLPLQFMAKGCSSSLWPNGAAAICYGQRSWQFLVAKCCHCNLLWSEVTAVLYGQMLPLFFLDINVSGIPHKYKIIK